MKKSLIFITCVWVLVNANINGTVYAASIEQPVAGITTVLDKVDPLEIDTNKYLWTKEKVNLRIKASLESEVITTISKREKVIFISENEDWIKIKYDNQEGYVYSKYLRDTELFTGDANRWGIELTYDEIELLAKILWLESQGEPNKGQQAVVEIVANRMVDMDFSDTLYEVLSDKNEFSTWKNVNIAKPTEKEYGNIYEVISGETSILSQEYVYFSTTPRNDKDVIKIGNHYFCKK